ncbi:MAG: hypothetical protein ACYDBB_10560 [Armatimonadota bacterium]
MSARPSQRKRDELLRHPIPLSAEDAAKLKKCEEQIRTGIKDFRKIGLALTTIREDKLYRGYPSFLAYCQKRWTLARRTVYQKIKVYQAYENVRKVCLGIKISPDDLPVNEYQVRQLLRLREPELQAKAWQHAVNLWKNSLHRAGKMTAGYVKTAVTLFQPTQQASLEQYITGWSSFSMIPYHMNICQLSPESRIPQFKLDPKPIIQPFVGKQLPGQISSSSPLVLVNPQLDIFSIDNREMKTFASDLLKIFHYFPAYRFIFWTMDHRFRDDLMFWPPNAELAVMVRTQEDMNDFADFWHKSNKRIQYALWVVPEEQIDIPSAMQLTRLLIGISSRLRERADDEIATIRRFVASALTNTSLPVHLHVSICNTFTKPAVELPSVKAPGASKKTLGEMHR